MTRIYKYIHSCFLIEKNGGRILIDPGGLTFVEKKVKPGDFSNISAILISHNHFDHYDANAIKIVLRNNPKCKIFTNQSTVETLEKEGIRAEVFADGMLEIQGFSVKAINAPHEPLPIPIPDNTAFLVDDLFLHTGDSLSRALLEHKAKVLALPISAPWLTMPQALEFVLEYKPEYVLPAHDGYIKDFFNDWQYSVWEQLLAEKNIKFHKLDSPGKWMEIED